MPRRADRRSAPSIPRTAPRQAHGVASPSPVRTTAPRTSRIRSSRPRVSVSFRLTWRSGRRRATLFVRPLKVTVAVSPDVAEPNTGTGALRLLEGGGRPRKPPDVGASRVARPVPTGTAVRSTSASTHHARCPREPRCAHDSRTVSFKSIQHGGCPQERRRTKTLRRDQRHRRGESLRSGRDFQEIHSTLQCRCGQRIVLRRGSRFEMGVQHQLTVDGEEPQAGVG